MARVESGKEEAHQKEIQLSEIISQIMKLMTQTAASKNIHLSSEDIAEDLLIFADGRHVRQIMINLISNGIKYTPAGGKVKISVETEGDKALICVTDNGVGIPVTDHHKVFQEYARLEDEYSQSQVGTGLGLNLTKRLVELNGGRIHFESKVGLGTKFIFSCPLYYGSLDDDKLNREYSDLNAKTFPNLQGLKILILEDDAHNLNLMKSLLEKLGANVVASENVQNALVLSEDIDVALVDIALRGESGNCYLSAMKNTHPDIPLIVVSACVFEKDINDARDKGADAFLAKPFDPYELVSLIRRTTIERVLVN
jgi:CheY-like chemotaxis protein/two-component sensor histidine kinase